MSTYNAPLNSDPWQWAQHLWWEVWFPETLKECRQALSQYYHGNQLYALIIPEGGFNNEGPPVIKIEKKKKSRVGEVGGACNEIIELEMTSSCPGNITDWENKVMVRGGAP